MAQPVLPSDDAQGTEDSESGDGTPTGDPFVLDVARGTRLRAAEKFGSHAGQLGTGDGVQQNTEKLIGRPAPFGRESEFVLMIAIADRRDEWVGPSS